MTNAEDIIGRRFHHCVAVGITRDTAGKKMIECVCDCGKKFLTETAQLVSGNRRSCGCMSRYHGKIDVVGKHYGSVTVLSKASSKRNGSRLFLCKCDCGNECLLTKWQLLDTRHPSCGCYDRSRSIIGKRFGKLTVMGYAGFGAYRCMCDCGNVSFPKRGSLTSGNTKSCGCMIGRSMKCRKKA